jgi:hypothetical protein
MVQGITPRSINLVRGGDRSSAIRIYRGFRFPDVSGFLSVFGFPERFTAGHTS